MKLVEPFGHYKLRNMQKWKKLFNKNFKSLTREEKFSETWKSKWLIKDLLVDKGQEQEISTVEENAQTEI